MKTQNKHQHTRGFGNFQIHWLKTLVYLMVLTPMFLLWSCKEDAFLTEEIEK